MRGTPRAVAKAGLSDPAAPHGRAVAQRIKVTPGITKSCPVDWETNLQERGLYRGSPPA